MSDEKLKPCPFCGGKARMNPIGGFGPVDGPTLWDIISVECSKCGAWGGVRKKAGWAIKAWNRRIK